jgi:hypothetical protein
MPHRPDERHNTTAANVADVVIGGLQLACECCGWVLECVVAFFG